MIQAKDQVKIFNVIFHVWKAWLLINGIRKGATVYRYSDSKTKWIKSEITSITNGGLASEWNPMFEIEITHSEPIQGNDPDYYIKGWYQYKDFGKEIFLINPELREFPQKTRRDLDINSIRYGMLVEYAYKGDFSLTYHNGVKVHFFNKKGVLVGNDYKFVPYSYIRRRLPHDSGRNRDYQRYFMGKPLEKVRRSLFIVILGLVTKAMRWTQSLMD